MSKPRIAVLLAAYNGAPWISEQIRSILSQRDVEVGVFVRDDCSTDGTVRILRDEFEQDERVVWILADSSSGSAGGNFRALILEANIHEFDYVAFSDQDDIWLPEKLTSAVRALSDNSVDGYSCAVTAMWPDGIEKNIYQSSNRRASDFLFEGAGQGCTFVMSAALIFRVRNFIESNKYLTDEFYYHDWLVYVLACSWGYGWFFDNKSHMIYRQHQGNDTGARGSFSAVIFRFSKIKSGWYLRQIGLAAKIHALAAPEKYRLNELAQVFGEGIKLGALRKCVLIGINGRRRLSDRIVLIVSVLLGWI